MKPRIPITDKRFRYVRAKDMDSNYLQRKFEQMKREAESANTCTTIPFVRRDK